MDSDTKALLIYEYWENIYNQSEQSNCYRINKDGVVEFNPIAFILVYFW